jgi:translocation and assembly module TamB
MRALRWIGIGLGTILLLFAFLLWLADTSIGHRFIADQIAAQAPKSGLRIRVGRIDGSIYNKAILRNVRVYDPQGLFLDASEVRLDWAPAAWLRNRLDIDRLHIPLATLHKLPKLLPSETRRPILPGFDIRIADLRIDRLRIEPALARERRIGSIRGSADINDGRAVIRLNAQTNGGDRLVLNLDAEPDGNRFDLETRLDAPAGGTFGKIIGTERPVTLAVTGDGDWTNWRGTLASQVSGNRVAEIVLTNAKGNVALDGRLLLSSITKGRVAALTGPAVRVRGEGRLENRRLDASLRLTSAALDLAARGIVDLANNAFDPLDIDVRLLQPKALLSNMTGRNVALKVRLDGAFARAGFDYLLTAPFAAFDQTGFENVRASGRGRLSASPLRVPVSLTARRVTGVGDVAGGILANLSVDGPLLVTTTTITGDDLRFRSDKLSGKITLFVDLATGRYDVGLAGQLNRYLIPGLGIVDVKTDLKVVPGSNGRGTRIAGRGQVWVRRLDNGFLASLTGGLPYIEAALERGTDGVLRFTNARLTAPGLRLTGNGYRRQDGTFSFTGNGRQAQYGPITRLVLDGNIARPKIDLLLARPNAAADLRSVRLQLAPDGNGFSWTAMGQSLAGAFEGNGRIDLPARAPALITITRLTASDITASGTLHSLTGGFAGQIMLAGGGVTGTLSLSPANGVQQVVANVRARDMRLEGPPVLSARRASFNGTILLDPRGISIDGMFNGQGLSRGNLSLARVAANVKLRGGSGEIRAALAGERGRSFDLQTVTQFSPNRIQLVGSGTVDRRPITLTSPAILTREDGGWRLQPTVLEFAGGRARLAGLFGERSTEVNANVSQLPLSIADIIAPGLGLGGIANGTLTFRQIAGEIPTGRADVRVRGLTRSGLVLSSKPVDVGVTAVLTGQNAAVRAVAVSGGQTIGRAQARITPGGTGDLGARLINGAMFAQIRYNGAADTLWRLTGVETFDVSGPVAIGADVTGSAANPVIRGSIRTTNARLESPITGTVLTAIQASGRFGGSRLLLDRFTARAGPEGAVSGTGSFDFAAGQNFGINLKLQADRARLLARDDIAATVTGPITVASDGRGGGLISGDLRMLRGSFKLGQAEAIAAVPILPVTEINDLTPGPVRGRAPSPWRMAIKARAFNQLAVTGLGIDSEWSANLDIGGTVTEPRILGRADLVRGGYEFAGKRFDLERGVIRFQGESPPDPVLDIVAQGDANNVSATIRVTGTGLRPNIAFSSVPALPEDELLARLLFGTSITNLSAPEAVQLAASVASLRGGTGLNPINALRKVIGLDRLRILPGDNVTGQKTSIAAGKYITRRLYAEVVTDGQGYSATRAEFQITRWLSILATISTIGQQSAAVRVSRDY